LWGERDSVEVLRQRSGACGRQRGLFAAILGRDNEDMDLTAPLRALGALLSALLSGLLIGVAKLLRLLGA
jgi:hypothetical protein